MNMDIDEILRIYEKEQFNKMFASTSNKYKKILNEYNKMLETLIAVNAEKDLLNSITAAYNQASSEFEKFKKDPDYDYDNRRFKVVQFALQQAKKRYFNYLEKISIKG